MFYLTSYSNPHYLVDFIDIAFDILGFPIDTMSLKIAGELPENIPDEKLYSRPFLPPMYDIDKDPIDDYLIDRLTNAIYEQLHNDMLNRPELFIDK